MILCFMGCTLFWFLLYRLQLWEHEDETPEERKQRYRLTIEF